MTFTRATEEPVADVQARRPTVQVSLSRVGVTDVEKVIRLRHNGGEQLFSARFECVVELGPDQKGAHMSRFEDALDVRFVESLLGEPDARGRGNQLLRAWARCHALRGDAD